jgi:hypothetical protein
MARDTAAADAEIEQPARPLESRAEVPAQARRLGPTASEKRWSIAGAEDHDPQACRRQRQDIVAIRHEPPPRPPPRLPALIKPKGWLGQTDAVEHRASANRDAARAWQGRAGHEQPSEQRGLAIARPFPPGRSCPTHNPNVRNRTGGAMWLRAGCGPDRADSSSGLACLTYS